MCKLLITNTNLLIQNNTKLNNYLDLKNKVIVTVSKF